MIEVCGQPSRCGVDQLEVVRHVLAQTGKDHLRKSDPKKDEKKFQNLNLEREKN